MDALIAARSKLNSQLSEDKALTVNDFLVKASSLALKKIPEVNSTWMDNVIRQYHFTDIGVAVSADGGTLTPVLRNTQNLGLFEVASGIKKLSENATDGTISVQDLQGGTFTITDLGMFGVKSLAPIVVQPQAAHLGVGKIEKRIIPNDDPEATELYKEVHMMTVTMSCDHRVIDGAVGSQWLATFKSLVEDPVTMLL